MEEKIINSDDSDLSSEPYHRFEEEELILRDHLAIDRTVLANERTLLAYIRTALAMIIGGLSLIQFFDSSDLIKILGWAFIPIGAVTLLIGSWRYRNIAFRIKKVYK